MPKGVAERQARQRRVAGRRTGRQTRGQTDSWRALLPLLTADMAVRCGGRRRCARAQGWGLLGAVDAGEQPYTGKTLPLPCVSAAFVSKTVPFLACFQASGGEDCSVLLWDIDASGAAGGGDGGSASEDPVAFVHAGHRHQIRDLNW